MKTKLELLRDVLAGRANVETEEAAEALCEELNDPSSETSLFFAGARAIASDPLRFDWSRLAPEVSEGQEDVDAFLAAQMAGAASGKVPPPEWAANCSLKEFRDLLAGRAGEEEEEESDTAEVRSPDKTTRSPSTVVPFPQVKVAAFAGEPYYTEGPAYPPDEDLAAAIKGGNSPWAEELLFRRYWGTIRAAVASTLSPSRIVGRDADVEDVAIEAYKQALVALRKGRWSPPRYYPPPPPLKPWLWAIARNVARAHIRKAKWPPLVYESDLTGVESPLLPLDVEADESLLASVPAWSEVSPLEAMAARESQEVLRLDLAEAMGCLPSPEREIVVMHFFHGLTNREIAESLGIPLPAVRQRRYRALARLRRMLGEESYGY